MKTESRILCFLLFTWNFMSFGDVTTATGDPVDKKMVTFHITNKCPFKIWPATTPTAGQPVIAKGGFALDSDRTKRVEAPPTWNGRIWARTGCNFTCHSSLQNQSFGCTSKPACQTGDCQNMLSCKGAIGLPPATLIVVSLHPDDGKMPSFYSVTLVDGYNLPVSMSTKPANPKCLIQGCKKNVNRACPKELQVLDRSGEVVACKSACLAFHEDAYCCRNSYGTPESCEANTYSKLFKEACPSYFSYAYDTPPPMMNCSSKDYVITFCPSKWTPLQTM